MGWAPLIVTLVSSPVLPLNNQEGPVHRGFWFTVPRAPVPCWLGFRLGETARPQLGLIRQAGETDTGHKHPGQGHPEPGWK